MNPQITFKQYLEMTDYKIVDMRKDSNSLLFPYYAVVDCYIQAYRSDLYAANEDAPEKTEFEPILKQGIARLLFRFNSEFRYDPDYQLVLFELDSMSRTQERAKLFRRLWNPYKAPSQGTALH